MASAQQIRPHLPRRLAHLHCRTLEDAVAHGDASPRDLAYLMDRVLTHRGQPQIYGTQYLVRDGVLTLWTVQEPAR